MQYFQGAPYAAVPNMLANPASKYDFAGRQPLKGEYTTKMILSVWVISAVLIKALNGLTLYGGYEVNDIDGRGVE